MTSEMVEWHCQEGHMTDDLWNQIWIHLISLPSDQTASQAAEILAPLCPESSFTIEWIERSFVEQHEAFFVLMRRYTENDPNFCECVWFALLQLQTKYYMFETFDPDLNAKRVKYYRERPAFLKRVCCKNKFDLSARDYLALRSVWYENISLLEMASHGAVRIVCRLDGTLRYIRVGAKLIYPDDLVSMSPQELTTVVDRNRCVFSNVPSSN